MGDSRDWTGGRLGPYQIGKRYRNTGDVGGSLYAAHHVETGRPALVLVPEPEDPWEPRQSCTVSVTTESSPPFLAMDVERPPPDEQSVIQGLPLAFMRLAGALSCVGDRADLREHLAQSPTPRQREPRKRTAGRWPQVMAGAMATGVFALVAVVLWVRHTEVSERRMALPPEPTAFAAQAETPAAIGYPMPAAPFPEQQKPPCRPEIDVEIRGGCWIAMERKAPCPKGSAEYETKCYMPVHEKKPEPRSVKP